MGEHWVYVKYRDENCPLGTPRAVIASSGVWRLNVEGGWGELADVVVATAKGGKRVAVACVDGYKARGFASATTAIVAALGLSQWRELPWYRVGSVAEKGGWCVAEPHQVAEARGARPDLVVIAADGEGEEQLALNQFAELLCVQAHFPDKTTLAAGKAEDLLAGLRDDWLERPVVTHRCGARSRAAKHRVRLLAEAVRGGKAVLLLANGREDAPWLSEKMRDSLTELGVTHHSRVVSGDSDDIWKGCCCVGETASGGRWACRPLGAGPEGGTELEWADKHVFFGWPYQSYDLANSELKKLGSLLNE